MENNITLNEIKDLIVLTEKSKIYKSGIITDTYNKIFDKSEKTTNCGSCLRTYFLKIKNYYADEIKRTEQPQAEHLTHQQAGAEITIINNAGIEPESDLSKLSNDRIIDVLDANDEVKELVNDYHPTNDEIIKIKVEKDGKIKEIEPSKLDWYLIQKWVKIEE